MRNMWLGVLAAAVVSAAIVWFAPQLISPAAAPESAQRTVEVANDWSRPPAQTAENELDGRVVGVTDGDTLTILTAGDTQLRVRLTEIDAPEKDQPWGQRAMEALSALVFNESVRVFTAGLDRYGRTLGRVYVNGKDVSAEMVRSGSAHAYRRYLTDRSFLDLEDQAREARRGLWSLPRSQTDPPWEWRHGGRDWNGVSTSVVARGESRPGQRGHSCGSKRYCREMASCAEAQFYLNSCGATMIDGDRDGIPCEAICDH